jgi:hypothetical protein
MSHVVGSRPEIPVELVVLIEARGGLQGRSNRTWSMSQLKTTLCSCQYMGKGFMSTSRVIAAD